LYLRPPNDTTGLAQEAEQDRPATRPDAGRRRQVRPAARRRHRPVGAHDTARASVRHCHALVRGAGGRDRRRVLRLLGQGTSPKRALSLSRSLTRCADRAARNQTGPLDASCVSTWQCFLNPDAQVQSSIASRVRGIWRWRACHDAELPCVVAAGVVVQQGYAQSMYVAGQMNKKAHTGAIQRCIPLAIWFVCHQRGLDPFSWC